MIKQATTLKMTLDLLNAFETTRFVDKATYSQRLAALPFFRTMTLHAFDRAEHGLPAEGDIASARGALAEHAAAVAAGRVKGVGGPPRTTKWLSTLQVEGEAIAAALQRKTTEPAELLKESPKPEPEPAAISHLSEKPAAVGETFGLVVAAQASSALELEHGVAQSDDSPPAECAPEVASMTHDDGAVGLDAAGESGGVPSDWEEPLSLAEAYGPDFPVHALAAWHQRFVTELAEQVQIPADVPALASLAMIGAAAAKTYSIQIQPGDEQPTNFWTLIVSPPGDGKTPLLGELRKPFDQVQTAMRDIDRADAARAETEHRIARIKLQRLEREAAISDDAEAAGELAAAAVEVRKQLDLRRPGLPTLLTGDCTQLGLISLMDRSNGRLLLLTDEGDQVFSRVQQRSPSGAEDIDDMLKAYSGATIDRHDAQRELRVPRAALSIVATTQPLPFAKVMGVEAYHSKGFIGRFALALPRSIQGMRKQRRAGVSEEARSGYQNLLSTLLEQPIPETPRALTLSEEAFDAFAARGAEADREIMTNRDASYGAWLGKLRGLTARVAGILHISDSSNHSVNVISGETMARAVEVSRYLEAHARVAYEQSERAALDEDPRRLLRWARDGRRCEFTHADAVNSFSGRLNARQVETCLERLVAAKYLRERFARRGSNGRPRKPSYLVNPCVFGGR